jgi:hypothetical protein
MDIELTPELNLELKPQMIPEMEIPEPDQLDLELTDDPNSFTMTYSNNV